jgi:hypothetical protein
MKRFIFLVIVPVLIFPQESLKKVKTDRRTESNLSTFFETLPEHIEVFVTSDSTYIIEAFYPDKKLVKRMTSAEYRDFVVKKPQEMVTLENAQISYLVGQGVLGLGLYSWSLPVMFSEADLSKGLIAIGLLTPLVYTSSCFLLTRDHHISSGAAYGSFLGGIEGAFQGGQLFKSGRGVFPVSLAENILDFTLGQNMGFTPAMYQRKLNHCAYGYYHYFAVKALFLGEGIDSARIDEDLQLSALLSLGEGYSSLFFSRKSEDLTLGDALFELRMSAMGAEALPLILATVDRNRDEWSDERVYGGLSLLGHGVGYLWGYKFTRDYDLPGAAGVIVWLLPYIAHATTGGLALLSDNETILDFYPAIYLTTDVLLTFVCYKTFARKSTEVGKADIPDFNFSINPMCFILKDKNKNFGKMPFLMFSYSFD